MKVATAILVLSACVALASAVKPTKFIRFDNQDFYVKGVNAPWFDGQYGHDIGNNAINHYGVWYNSTLLDRWFGILSGMGFNTMRVWLLEGLEGYLFDGDHYITGIDPLFLQHLDNLIGLASKHKLYLYFTVTDQFFNTVAKDIMVDLKARQLYLDLVLGPLVKRYKGNNAIFAFDLINEIEASIEGRNGNWGSKGATWDQARSFMSDCVKTIKSNDPGRLVSSGSGWHDYQNVKNGSFSGLGFDFYDYHSYSTTGFLNPANSVRTDLPIIVGEFGQTNTDNKRDDTLQAKVDIAYVNNLINNNYAGGCVWAFSSPTDTDVYGLVNANGSLRPAGQEISDFNHSFE